MSVKLEASHFTNKADPEKVKKKYEKTFKLVLGKEKELKYSVMQWVSKEEWEAFCYEVLPQCASLEVLKLNDNPNLEVNIVELVAKLPPTLRELYLGDTGCFGEGANANWARLPALTYLDLEKTNVIGLKESLASSGCKARQIRGAAPR